MCPRCRRVVPLARPCDADGEAALDLHLPAQRRAFVQAVWGLPSPPPSARTTLARPSPKRTGTVAAALVAATVIGGLATTWPLFAFPLITAAALLPFLRSRDRVLPATAATPPRPRAMSVGRIDVAAELVAPGSGAPGAAWAIELRLEGTWHARTTLRVGATAGFELALEGGGRARVPAGPIAIHGEMEQLGDLEHSLEALLHALDPQRALRDPFAPFPHNVVDEQTLHLGDRVELYGELAPRLVAATAGSETGYRDAPTTELVPVGLPVLRLI